MSGSIKVGGNTIATHTGAQGAGEVTLGTNLRLPASGGIQDSSGNNILTESGGNVSVGNIRLPASGGIKDSSGNNILTESGGTVTFGNVIGGVPAGAIMSFAMSSAPSGWIVCNGAEYAIADYGDLHTAIGTTWGALTTGSGGAGSTHFRVPDLRGAFLRGTGTGTYDGRSKVGPSVGDFDEDEFQGHAHKWSRQSGTSVSTAMSTYGSSALNVDTFSGGGGSLAGDIRPGNPQTGLPNDYGDVRTGNETKPFNAGINYCIKY